MNIDSIKEKIEQAEYVVVGIGEGFGYDWTSLQKDERYMELAKIAATDDGLKWVIPFLQKVSMDTHPDVRLESAYEALENLTKDKDCYYITTTIDDYIYRSSMPKNRIVTPCGGFGQLQCEKACTIELTKMPNALLQYVQKLYNNMIDFEDIRDKYPECPNCGADLVYNQVGCEHYVEAGYLPGWGEYHKWIEKTMNRELLMLELGAGLGFMSVIRTPFERLATYNLKSTLVRVHPSLYMGTPEISERVISVAQDPIAWMLGE